MTAHHGPARDPHEAAERAWDATGDWEMAVEAALAAQRMAAAPEPQPAPASLSQARRLAGQQPAPGTLRADLEATVRIWREESEPYPAADLADNARRSGFGSCAGELAQILAQHAEPRPAPGTQRRPGYVTVNARDIAIALNGYAGFTGDPALFASELHERLRRTVFADGAKPPQPAPDPDVCECGHHWAHHAFSDDVCAVVACPCTRPRAAQPPPEPPPPAGALPVRRDA